MNLSRQLFTIHSWFGLVTGVFLLMLGVSGSLLIFKEELDHLMYHDLLTVKPQETPLTLDSLYKIAVKHYPNLDGLAWINPSAPKDHSYHFRLYLNDSRLISYDLGALNIDQYTGKILRQGRSDDLEVGWMEWLFQFHFSFHLGTPGAALVAIFGIAMLISVFTGLVIYRKYIWKVVTFNVPFNRKNRRTLSSSLHRIIGVWALIFNVVILFTGFWLNLFSFEKKVWENEMIPTPPNTLVNVSLDSLYAKALQKMPDLTPTYVYFPTQPKRTFSVRGILKGQNPLFAGGNSIQFDGQTGRFLSQTTFEDLSFWRRIKATFYPLHVGNFGGILLKILYIIIGLTPGLLSVTGFLLWRRRKKKTFNYFPITQKE
ncbi:PepSY-associated TM helix domain-containing protein [Runella sp.]|uniref:PepSY-associated TM helix domain-containing protein n=1 Tax=Runella sp. TaxID=1960881 RepID=UPI003D09A504